MSDYKSDITASECIEDNMGVYADYTIGTKFPHVLDGLKPIHRRVLIVLHKKAVKEPGLQKELTVVGDVVKMHPHGDASIGQAISVMAQPFTHIAPLVFSDCNIGNYVGDAPAATRYVDVAEADIAKALFFQDINFDMLKMVPCESEQGSEPAYLIPRIPTSLLVQSFAIAIGFKTETFPLSVGDLCKMTKEYIRLRSSGVDWIPKTRAQLVKYTLPDFATASVLRNSKDLLAAYRRGDYSVPVVMDGTMQVKKDQIIISTLPPDKAFHTVTYNEGSICAKQKNSWEAQNFQQMMDFPGEETGIMKGCFKCELRRGINPFDVLATLKKKLQFTSNWKPDPRYVDEDGNMSVETPFTLMDKWYEARYAAVLGDLKQRLKDMVDQQRRLLALVVICDHLDDVYKIFKSSKDEKETVPKLVSMFKLSRYQATYLSTLKFSQMTAKGREDLLKDLEQIKKDMEELQTKFHQIPDIMIASVESFEEKFVNHPYKQEKLEFDLSRRCIAPKYIGAAIFRDNGYILVEDEKEFDQVLKDFTDPDEISFKLFSGNGHIRSIGHEEDIDCDVPKYIKSDFIDRLSDQRYTACICNKGGALITEKLIGRLDSMSSIKPIGKKFIAIYKNGTVSLENVTERVIRKNPSAGPTMKDVICVEDGMEEAIVVHANTSQPNILVFERVNLSGGQAKLHKIPVGQWMIIGVIDPTVSRVYLNIPKEVRQRCVTRHIVVDNIGSLIQLGERKFCVFGRSTAKSNFNLEPLRRKSTIMKVVPV